MVDEGIDADWPIEEIPDDHRVFMRIHKTFLKRTGQIAKNAFQDRGGAMSTDWEKYRTPEQALQAARNPSDNGVVALNVGQVRAIDSPRQIVVHTPDRASGNRAHTDIRGEKKVETRVKLKRIATWVTQPPTENR